ncbi:MAG: CAP domain-containing protein [Spirochaetia bacterium]
MEEEALSQAAGEHAEYLSRMGRLSHIGRYGEHADLRIRDAGSTGIRVTEIIGYGEDLEDVISAWMDSRDHRAALENPRWTRYGFGQAQTEEGSIFVVLFRYTPFRDLEIERKSTQLVITGRCTEEILPVIQISTTAFPIRLDDDRSFSFAVPEHRVRACFDLGVQNIGNVEITDRICW